MKNKLISILFALLLLAGCGAGPPALPEAAESLAGMKLTERVELKYAERFTIDRYEGGFSLISVADGSRYLTVPEGTEPPEGLDKDIRVIQRPPNKIYLAATAVMCFFDAMDRCDAVRFSSLEPDGWYIDGAREAMERGDMVYAGKYREPDYELLLSEGCGLSIQSTMIGHSPQVREKLEELGITVFVDNSSYESHPLGRSEWVKVYGELLGESERAKELFEEQAAYLDGLTEPKGEKKTVVCFYISGAGKIVTRKSGDYISKMIGLAGGRNLLSEKGEDNAVATVTMEPEEFYTKARNADILIYNGAVSGEVDSLAALTAKNSLLADFKAVKNGDVWCTKKNFFQETLSLGAVIGDFGKIISGGGGELKYLFRLGDAR